MKVKQEILDDIKEMICLEERKTGILSEIAKKRQEIQGIDKQLFDKITSLISLLQRNLDNFDGNILVKLDTGEDYFIEIDVITNDVYITGIETFEVIKPVIIEKGNDID